MALLEENIQDGVPAFLTDEIVFRDKLLLYRKQYCVILARNLKFYQFYHKQLLNCIDLTGTCLRKVAQNIRDYKGPKGKYFKSDTTRSGEGMGNALMETTELQDSVLAEEEANDVKIAFGKYVYRNFDINKLYFLIHCWNKLVVIAFPDLAVVSEYEGVKSFRIVHGKVKFIAILELQFENGDTECTDFQKNENSPTHQEDNSNIANTRSSFRRLLERVRCAKAELQLHKSTTQKEFDILRDLETHGCNYVRSDQLEEKPMISRCGDIWSRFVTNDTLVLGVPLVNNCGANNLTIPKNLKPILKINDSNVENIFYKYCLYQLKIKFEDMETMETFFQTEDDELRSNEQFWSDCKLSQLLPASFGVLLIAIKTSQILLLEECPLFLCFEIEKERPQRPGHSVKTRIYEQQIFLKNINVSELLINREKYGLFFDQISFHQDFLACAMISKETTLYIEFQSEHNAIIFEKLIRKQFNFKTLGRKLTAHEHKINHSSPADLNEDKSNTTREYIASAISFNNDPTSLWFGSMVLKTTPCAADAVQVWKLYLYSEEKAFVCLKSLYNELALVNCNIKNMKYFIKKNHAADNYFLHMKNALATEMEFLKNLNKCDDTAMKKNIFMDLMKSQIASDVLIVTL